MKAKYFIPVFLMVAWFLAHTLLIVLDGLNDELVRSDAAIVFGNQVNKDGSLSPRLQARLLRAEQIYHDSLVSFFFVSGGVGKEGFPEGTVMKRYLQKAGIPEEQIIADDAGNTTEKTIENYKLKFGTEKPVLVISQYYHISRIKLLCRQAGFKKVYAAHASYFEWRDLYSVPREFFAYYYYLIKNL